MAVPEHSEAASTASAAEPTVAPSAGAALPRTILERALLRSFADPGPNPTAFGACPGAAYQCNERSHRANSGWFVVFSSDLVISCGEIRAEDGSRAAARSTAAVSRSTQLLAGPKHHQLSTHAIHVSLFADPSTS